MTNYQALIKKLQLLRKTYCPTVRYDFTPSELELIADALETIQFLEIILKVRKQSFGEAKENHEPSK